MPSKPERRGRLRRLAPIAFVAGLVLLGLGLFALSFSAAAPGHGPLEYNETHTVGNTAILAYPAPVSPHVAARLEVTFEFPLHSGTAMVVGCRDYAAILDGRKPLAPQVVTEGRSGGFSLGLTASPFDVPSSADASESGPSMPCPFVYAVFQWTLEDEPYEANLPEVMIATSSLFLPGVAGALVAGSTLLGAALATVGGIVWGRRLNRERAISPAEDDESTAETLLLVLHKTGDWLERMRRYLVVAGVLGVFLWYPVVLPWVWRTAMEGTSQRWHPWLFAGGALAMLLTLTAIWAREYLRLDRELLLWRERVARLHERESAMLSEFGEAG